MPFILKQAMSRLGALANEENAAGKKRFGIAGEVFGVGMAPLRSLAKEIGKDEALAKLLWKQGQNESKILALLIWPKEALGASAIRFWEPGLDSWDVVDQAASLLAKQGRGMEQMERLRQQEEEYSKRLAFSLMAMLALHGKKIPDREFVVYLDWIKEAAGDERNFVKKSVNWALRQIGKRSMKLHPLAVQLARELAQGAEKSAQWIGKNALKELLDPEQIQRLQKKRL